MDYVLKTEALTKTYGRHKALDNFSMCIPPGAIYGLVGKNGAGKTTLLRLICGLQTPTAAKASSVGVQTIAYYNCKLSGTVPLSVLPYGRLPLT